MQHAPNVGPNLFAHNENSAYIIPHVTAHAVMSCAHHTAHTCRQAGCPYVYMVHQKLLMDMSFAPAEQYLSKLTTSHFSTLNMRNANQNMLKGFSLPCTTRTRPIAMRTSGYVQRNL